MESYFYLEKNWSGHNRNSQTVSAGPVTFGVLQSLNLLKLCRTAAFSWDEPMKRDLQESSFSPIHIAWEMAIDVSKYLSKFSSD